MNQAVKEALLIVVRQSLISLGTALGITGLLTPYIGVATNAIVAMLLVLVAAGWSQISQQFKRGKLMQALEKAGTTERKVAQEVKSSLIPTPSVLTPVVEVPSAGSTPSRGQRD